MSACLGCDDDKTIRSVMRTVCEACADGECGTHRTGYEHTCEPPVPAPTPVSAPDFEDEGREVEAHPIGGHGRNANAGLDTDRAAGDPDVHQREAPQAAAGVLAAPPDRLAEISARWVRDVVVLKTSTNVYDVIRDARDDIPWLIAEVERLRAAISRKDR
jgi:hypothetical protein